MGRAIFVDSRKAGVAQPKRNDIPTPPHVAGFLASLFPDESFVFDPCCGDGALLDPFACETAGVDIKSGFDFMNREPECRPSLVVCNPPFSFGTGKMLGSEQFLRRIVDLWPGCKIALFCPMGFRLNQREKSERRRWLRDEGPPITSIVALPLDAFVTRFHIEIVIFNAPELKPHYFLP